MPFGIFVELYDGLDDFYISQLSEAYVSKMEDAVAAGDKIDVKVTEYNGEGQCRVAVTRPSRSRRAAAAAAAAGGAGAEQFPAEHAGAFIGKK